MSVRFSGTKRFAKGIIPAIAKQLKLVTLKPAKRVVFRVDPFTEQAGDFRNLMWFMSAPVVRQTNPKCTFKTEIANDRCQPSIVVSLENTRSVVFRAGNLNTLEILRLWNEHISPLAATEATTAAKQDDKTSGKTKAGKARLR